VQRQVFKYNDHYPSTPRRARGRGENTLSLRPSGLRPRLSHPLSKHCSTRGICLRTSPQRHSLQNSRSGHRRALSSLVKKMRPINLQDLEEKLKIWRDREVEKCLRDDISPDRIYDQYECLCFFTSSLDEDSRSVDSLLAKIELMFTDDTNGSSSSRVTLSTVHKAKGLEFPTVFLLDKEKYMPSRYAKQPWQIRQEYNLLYVAVTRAMEKLIYISSDSWKELE
jgi:superfamily I DNA/RNA helicase